MTGTRENRPISVLVVEDDEDDLHLIKQAFRRANIPVFVASVKDGGEARAAIGDAGSGPLKHRPDLLFLDLNLPTVDGRDILTWMRNSEDLSSIPIVVLTGLLDAKYAALSDEYDDVLCFEKPTDLGTMTQIVNQAVLTLT